MHEASKKTTLVIGLGLALSGVAEVDDFYAMDTAFSWMTRHDLACTNDVKDYVIGILDEMQVPNVRERFSWSQANPAPGVWKADGYVRNAQLLHRRGFRVSNAFHDAPQWTDIPYRGGVPRDLLAVYRSCRDIATAFGDSVETWEVWNEEDITVFSKAPAWDYAAFLKAAYLGFRAAPNPPRVALGALCLPHRGPFDEALFANDAAAYFDVFNFHTYLPLEGYDRVFGELNRFRQAHGIGDRLYYLTEFGRDFPATGAPQASGEALQAEFIPKAWMSQRMLGVGRGYYFISGPYRQKNGTYELGLLRATGERKAAYFALRRHIAEVGRFRLEGELAVGSGVKAYLFTAADGAQSLMYWSVSPVDAGCVRKGDYKVADELSRTFRVGGKTLTATRVPGYVHGLHGLAATVAPVPRGKVGATSAAADEDRSVVLRVDFAPGETLLDGDRGGVEILRGALHAKVVVWNLSDEIKKGRLVCGRDNLDEIALAPWGCATVDVVRVSTPADAMGNWTIAGVFNGRRTSRLVVPVRDFGAARFRRVPLELEAADWKLNDSASSRQVRREEDGSFRFDYGWKDLRTDRWFYPRPDLKGLSLAGVRFVEFEVAATGPGAKEGWKQCNLNVHRPDDPATCHLAFAPPADDGSWEVRRVKLPQDFTPASFTLGGNPVATNVTWRIRRLTLLKLEFTHF